MLNNPSRGVVAEYIAARDAYEDAVRPLCSHGPARILKHGDPVLSRYRAARAALQAALPAVPPDWVMVPREPTREMVAAGAAEISRPATATNRAHWAYAAMLAATPAQDNQEGEG